MAPAPGSWGSNSKTLLASRGKVQDLHLHLHAPATTPAPASPEQAVCTLSVSLLSLDLDDDANASCIAALLLSEAEASSMRRRMEKGRRLLTNEANSATHAVGGKGYQKRSRGFAVWWPERNSYSRKERRLVGWQGWAGYMYTVVRIVAKVAPCLGDWTIYCASTYTSWRLLPQGCVQ